MRPKAGDGSFQIRLRKLNTNIGYRVSLLYSFHLHIRDLDVLKGLASYFNNNSIPSLACAKSGRGKNLTSTFAFALQNSKAKVEKKVGISEDKSVHLQIAKFTDINEKIIPFFDKYPIKGVKSLDFEDFKKVCKLIENKKHLTPLPLLLPLPEASAPLLLTNQGQKERTKSRAKGNKSYFRYQVKYESK